MLIITAHSGLLLTSYCSGVAPCEQAWLSGGLPLSGAIISAGGGWKPHDLSHGRNIWKARVPAEIAAAGALAQSAMHWLDDLGGSTVLDRARWPNRQPSVGTVDKPSLLDISGQHGWDTTAVWLQKPNVKKALHKRVASPAVPLSVTREFNNWMVGVGGECERFDPPAAAICNPNATGGATIGMGLGRFFRLACSSVMRRSSFPI